MLRRLLPFAAALALAAAAAAQTSPFLPDDLYRKLDNELSGDRAYDDLRELTRYHAPNGSGRGFRGAAQWIEQRARALGLVDVKTIQLPYDEESWTPVAADLWLIAPDGRETRLISYPEISTAVADHSRPVKAEAELVYVGAGTEEQDYAGVDVKGKVVLAYGRPGAVEEEAVWKRGALGIVSYWSSRVNPADYPDQVAWSSINDGAAAQKKGKQPSFAIMLSWRQGNALRERLTRPRRDPNAPEGAAPRAPEPLRVRVSVESVLDAESTQGIVEGWIRGTKSRPGSAAQQVVLTSHIQEERYSANDDRSGVANMLEIARALVTLINQGKLPRPERDIRFWWVNEIDAPYTYFAVHPEERKNIFVNVNQDMVGANQTVGGLSRVQQVTRTPWSRPTFFNDVVESVVMAIYHGNNAYLAPRSNNALAPGSPFTRPIYSHLGSRDRWAAEIVPFFTQSDHMVFNDGRVATVHGGVTFTNWPDEHIHSTDDDMWQMDRTQFKRSALAVTALAWFMANAGPKDAEIVHALLLPNATARIQRDIAAARAAVLQGKATPHDEWLVRTTATQREQAALASLATLDPQAPYLKTGQSAFSAPPLAQAPGVNAQMAARVPVPIADLVQYFKRRGEMKPVRSLHGYMRYEALNFMDGRRSLWDIYAAVRAESLAAGEWYYGKVTPEMITQLFDHAAAAGMITWKESPPAQSKPRKKQ